MVRLGTGWRLCVLVYCALAYCAAGDNTMVRIDASKVDVRAFTRRALNLGESDEITCNSADSVQCPSGEWERVVSFDNETLSSGNVSVSVYMVECFCNNQTHPKSCCGDTDEVYTTSFCGKQLTTSGSDTSDAFITAELYNNWITGAFSTQRTVSTTDIITGETWKENCPTRLGEGAGSDGESCTIKDHYDMFTEIQAEAFIASVAQLLPDTRNVTGSPAVDVNGTVTGMSIAMNLGTCNDAGEMCTVDAEIQAAWAKNEESAEAGIDTPGPPPSALGESSDDDSEETLLDSSAVTCVSVQPMDEGKCDCLGASEAITGQMALRNAISSARGSFVIEANAAFQEVNTARLVATNFDVAQSIFEDTRFTKYKERAEHIYQDKGLMTQQQLNEKAVMALHEMMAVNTESDESIEKQVGRVMEDGIRAMMQSEGPSGFTRLAIGLCTIVEPQKMVDKADMSDGYADSDTKWPIKADGKMELIQKMETSFNFTQMKQEAEENNKKLGLALTLEALEKDTNHRGKHFFMGLMCAMQTECAFEEQGSNSSSGSGSGSGTDSLSARSNRRLLQTTDCPEQCKEGKVYEDQEITVECHPTCKQAVMGNTPSPPTGGCPEQCRSGQEYEGEEITVECHPTCKQAVMDNNNNNNSDAEDNAANKITQELGFEGQHPAKANYCWGSTSGSGSDSLSAYTAM